jgi:hypothetical protein
MVDKVDLCIVCGSRQFAEVGNVVGSTGGDEPCCSYFDSQQIGRRQVDILGMTGEAEGYITQKEGKVSHRGWSVGELGVDVRYTMLTQQSDQPRRFKEVQKGSPMTPPR